MIKCSHRVLLAGLLICVTARAASAQSGNVILDETAYCRAYAQFGCDRVSPAMIRKEIRENTLSKRDILRLRGRRRSEDDKWQDSVYQSYAWLQYGGSRDEADRYTDTPPPPSGWAAPGFDDTRWLYQKKPLMIEKDFWAEHWYRRAAYYRFRFHIPDPAAAGDLKLRLVYRGGARVLFNGAEVASGHLPKGEITGQTRGDDYPIEAYVEIGPDGKPLMQKRSRRGKPGVVHVGWMNGSFDEAPKDRKDPKKRATGGKCTIDRSTWTRLQKLRDRVIEVTVPAKQVKKGINVLAVEIRVSDPHPVTLRGDIDWRSQARGDVYWPHGQIIKMQLRDTTGKAPSALKRPKGIHVWPEDMHRSVISAEYMQQGVPGGTLRFVGTANGKYSAQVVVSTDRELTGLTLTPGDLKTGDGATIPASAVRIRAMVPHDLTQWRYLGRSRGGMAFCTNTFIHPVQLALSRDGPPGAAKLPREKRMAECKKMFFFDHISESAEQAPIPADSCRPTWVTLSLPADAKPGTYKGALSVTAKGMGPVVLPVEAEVYGWRIPDPVDFQANAALEQSPYGVALWYKVPLWSDGHFRLMEGSLKQLALIGNDWLNIPVITHTEFGNVKDSMIPWSRKADGSLAFDYSRLDRYLDLAVKYLGKPKVINFIVTHGTHGNPADIEVKDEKAGEVKTLKLDSAAPGYEKNWKAFGASLYAYMRGRRLEKNMYWGYRWDSIGDANLPLILAKVAPKVYWTAGAHRGKEHILVKAYSQLLPFRLPSYSRQGWKNPDFHVLLPREGGSLIAATGAAFPVNFRLAIDRSLCVGMNGVGRMGADYGGDSYGKGLRKEGWLRAGMPNHFMLWPGKDQPEASTRFMALREGYQETEARIYLEQLIDRQSLPEDLAKRAAKVLLDHHRRTLFVASMCEGWTYVEVCRDWQDRSRALFSVAAEAARAIPLDLGTGAIVKGIPARGKRVVQLRVRNCTSQPRAWTLKADQPWIVPEKTAGNLKNSDRLSITLDAEKAEPGKTVKGQAILTDTASGREYPVPITARISGVMSFYSGADMWPRKHHVADKGKVAFNTPVGKSESRDIVVNNLSGKVLPWSCKSPSPWIKLEPSSGKALPQSPISIKVTVTPPDKEAAFHQFSFDVTEAGGPVKVTVPLAIHVVTAYSRPELPTGLTAKPLTALEGNQFDFLKKAFKDKPLPQPTIVPTSDSGSPDAKGGYDLEGKKISAFSVEVSFPQKWRSCGFSGPPAGGARAIFEIVVDGKIRACSGFLNPQGNIQTAYGQWGTKRASGLERRLLVVDGLENAKKLMLINRIIPPGIGRQGTVWQNATLYFKK